MHGNLLNECGLLSYFNEDIIRYIRPELLHSGIILNFTHTIIQAYNNKLNEYLKKL